MKRKNRLFPGIAVAAAIAGLCAAVFLLTHVSVDREFFSKNAETFDLTDHALSEEAYLNICRQYPDVEILWTVPFQGSRYPTDTDSLTITSLTEAEAQTLDYFPNLKLVDATQCTDFSALVYLQQRRPDCEVRYQVPLGSTGCSSLSGELTIQDADAEQLLEQLAFLPRLRDLTLEGRLPEAAALLELKNAYPEVALHYTLNLGGRMVPSHAQKADLSGSQVTQQELARLLPLLPELQELNLMGTALTDSEKKGLMDQFPGIFFLCQLDFCGIPCSTDSTEIDISGCAVTVAETEAMLPYFPRLTRLIMCNCGIDNETMDALNQRHPQVRIVWSMQVGLATVRTDDTYFFPALYSQSQLPKDEELKQLRYCPDMIAIDLGHSKVTEIEWVRYMPHLRYLILADTPVADLTPLSGLKELIYLEVFSTNVTDYSPLVECTALQNLNIGNTYGDPEPLTRMPWLHILQWFDVLNHTQYLEETLQLTEQLPDTLVVYRTSRKNIGGIWRYIPHYYVFREVIGGDFFNQELSVKNWGKSDSKKILACHKGSEKFAGDVLAEIVRYRIDNGLPIPGIKNIGSEKAEILYQSLLELNAWYWQHNGE